MSKDWFDVCLLLGREHKAVRYGNDAKGFESFISSVKVLARKIHVCMEHTGGYETAFALALKKEGFIVSIVDGAKISAYRESFTRSKAKSDAKDAYYLARYCKERRPSEWSPAPDEYRLLQDLVRQRQDLIDTQTLWKNRSSHIVQSELVTVQRQTQLGVLEIQLKDIDNAIKEHLEAFLSQELALLETIPGFQITTAARLLAEAGPITNYSSARSFAMAAGLSPISIHSGKNTRPGKLPVYGNVHLRNALYFPVLVSLRRQKGIYPFLQRIASNGHKSKMTVVVAGMRKLAHIVYGVLKHNKPFDPDKLE